MVSFLEPRWYDAWKYWREYDALKREAEEKESATGVKQQIDHIVPKNSPLVKGLNVPWNLQVCPYFLNAKKGNRWWPTMTADEVKEAIAFYKARGDI